jgi:hypothetical protein
MRRRLLLFALLVAAAACRRRPPPPPPVAPPVATVVRAEGAVWRARAGGAREAVAGGEVSEGDVLSTGADGTAVVRLGPGRELELQPEARVKLRREGGEVVAEVERGRVVSRSTGEGGRLTMTVLTPFGITRVPAGRSEATIHVTDEGVRIDVIEVSLGKIAFVDRSGTSVTAGTGEAIEVKLGRVELVHATPPPEPERLEVLLSSESGPLLVRAPGERRFTPRRAAPAPAGTGYRLGTAQARARLLAPGLRVRLGGGATGQVGDAARSAEGRQFDLSLEKGTALVSLEGGQAHQLVLPGRHPVTVRATEPTTLAITAGRDGETLDVVAGSAEVEAGGGRQRVGPGQRAQVQGKRLRVGSRPPSDVVLPTARGLRVYADVLGDVTLSWPAAGEGSAFLEVASDPDFKDLLASGRPAGNSVTVPAPRRDDLYWRVTRGGKTLLGHARFDPDPRRSVLDLEHPQNLVSESGPVTTVYFQSVVPALTFAWGARPGAARYRLRVYRAGALDRPLVERVVAELRAPVEAGVLAEGSYVWHAVPLDATGAELAGGRLARLELVYDNALTRLAIGSPKPNEVATGPEVEALGVAPLGSKLYINGKPARLDGKGRFAEKVPRAPALVFRLVTRNGSETYWVRKLRVGS